MNKQKLSKRQKEIKKIIEESIIYFVPIEFYGKKKPFKNEIGMIMGMRIILK